MYVDFVINNGTGFEGHGDVGRVMQGVRFDPGMMRPYLKHVEGRNQRFVTVNTGRMVYDNKLKKHVPSYKEVKCEDLERNNIYSPVWNTTSLRKEDWIAMDQTLVTVARQRLRAWQDLASRSRYSGFNAMAHTTLEYEAMNDPGEAQVTMTGLGSGRTDTPLFDLRSVPLPITFSDFNYPKRLLMVSQNSGRPLSTVSLESAGRRVAETVEKTLIGTQSGISYGYQSTGVTAHNSDIKSKVYGYLNYPKRLTNTSLTAPTGSNANTIVSEWIALRESLFAQNFYGPFMVYTSTDWDRYLDEDYVFTNSTGWAATPTQTLRSRLQMIDGLTEIKRLDYLTPAASHAYTLLMIQMTSDVVQAIEGMQPTVVQWRSPDDMELYFKVMCIMVPLLKSDYNDQCGILHARTA